jgi:poly(3-hydroxybutyrate) depolymerase
MRRLSRSATVLLVALAAGMLLSACGPRFPDNRYEEPFEYYLYVPENYDPSGQYYLFLALHGSQQDGADCYEDWRRYALEVRFILLCPTMPMAEEGYDIAQAEIQLAAILTDIYDRYSLAGQFFLAGYEVGADFALPYTYRYPNAIFGVAVIGPTDLPSASRASNIPTLLVVGEEETDERQQAVAFNQILQSAGYTIRLVAISGMDESPPADSRRLSVDLYRDLTY